PPIDTLRLVVGALLLVFGLQWLRKAMLRSSGYKALHDEGVAFAAEREQATLAGRGAPTAMDWYSFTVAFKGVLLEGLEIVFIVVTFGAAHGRIAVDAAAAVTAVALVVIAGIAVRSPLERVPENTIKFAVGLLLTSFGIFWGGEGAGVNWPGSEDAILASLGLLRPLVVALVHQLRRQRLAALPAGVRARGTSDRSHAACAD